MFSGLGLGLCGLVNIPGVHFHTSGREGATKKPEGAPNRVFVASSVLAALTLSIFAIRILGSTGATIFWGYGNLRVQGRNFGLKSEELLRGEWGGSILSPSDWGLGERCEFSHAAWSGRSPGRK